MYGEMRSENEDGEPEKIINGFAAMLGLDFDDNNEAAEDYYVNKNSNNNLDMAIDVELLLQQRQRHRNLNQQSLASSSSGSYSFRVMEKKNKVKVRHFSHELKVNEKSKKKNMSQEFVRVASNLSASASKVLARSFSNNNATSVGGSAKTLCRQRSHAHNALQGLRLTSRAIEDPGAFWNAVEARFQALASSSGDDGLLLLSRDDFGTCIGVNDSKEFALGLFDALSRRRGLQRQKITKDELRDLFLRISDQSFDARLEIFFDMCEEDAGGRITEEEIKELIMLSASANRLSRLYDRAEEYANLIMEDLDPDNLGYIELRQLKAVLQNQYQHRSQNLSQTIAIAPIRRTRLSRALLNAKHWLDENWQRTWVMALWIGAMVGLSSWKFYQYRERGVYKVMGFCVCTAKASAETIKLNMALILLPVCRNTITWLRSTLLGSIVPFDDNINFHKTIAGAIAVAVLLHVTNHLACDFPRIIAVNQAAYELYLEHFLSQKRPNYWHLLLGIEGLTGIAMVVLMCVAYLLATSWFRRNSVKLPCTSLHKLTGFNAFWYSHHAFVAIYALLLVHSQCLYFAHHWYEKSTWMYLCLPMLIYAGERTLRALRARRYLVDIVKVGHGFLAAIYPGNVLALYFTKPAGLQYQSGMYLFLQCPQVSPFEWHPFSITSAPTDDHISVHIRTAGDWTLEMKRIFSQIMEPPVPGKSGLLRLEPVCGEEHDGKHKLPKLRIDGPYGAPAQDYKKYDVLLLIGLGIGATPFISILKDMLNNMKCTDRHVVPQISRRVDSNGSSSSTASAKKKRRTAAGPAQAYFYWVTREQGSLDWFKGVMNEIADMDDKETIEMHNYLTSVYEEGDSRSALIAMLQNLNHAKNGVDILSGTRVKTHFAKPNWKNVLLKVASAHSHARIGVFYCGPLILAKELKSMTKDYNHKLNTKFEFHKENF